MFNVKTIMAKLSQAIDIFKHFQVAAFSFTYSFHTIISSQIIGMFPFWRAQRHNFSDNQINVKSVGCRVNFAA